MEQASLKETVFCDFNHSAVSSMAEKLSDGETNTEEIIQSVFKHVRDNIRFGFDIVQVKASETLVKGYGACWNKALLMVALLRRNKIPARLAYYPVKRDFMRPVMDDVVETLPETMNHCLSQVLLNGEWIAIDATLDYGTYQKLFIPHNVTWGIDWNGKEDILLYTENIAGRVDFFNDIDTAIQRNVDNAMPFSLPSEAKAYFGAVNRKMWQAVAE